MDSVFTSFKSLEKYIINQEFKGYDCYDALNSPILRFVSFNKPILRIALIQALKKFPIQIRPLLGIKPGLNPKGLGLLLSAFSRIYRHTQDKNYLKLQEFLANLLINIKSPGYSGACWGYNFDWQSRVFFVPKYTPTIVNTSYIARGFLEAYFSTGNKTYLETARSSCEFILRDLHHTIEEDTLCFSYTPIDRLKVHNANILGASLLAKVFAITGETQLLDYADRSVRYVLRYQTKEGSWHYAETAIQQWIDSFHTGFVLESLHDYIRSTGRNELQNALEKGYRFYLEHFFLKDGTPKYYHNRIYPIDIHSAAQGIVTLVRLASLDQQSSLLAEKLVNWTIKHMQSPKGYFYFQKHRYYTNRIAYMRWSQAWMYHALTTFLYPPNDTPIQKE